MFAVSRIGASRGSVDGSRPAPIANQPGGSAHLLHARLWFAKRVERLPTSLVSYRWTNLLLRIIGTVHLNK